LPEKSQQSKEIGAVQTVGNSSDQPPRFDLFEVWKECQKIATHFNDLLIRIRSQSLAAVATFATIAGVLVKGESINADLRWGALTAVFSILSIFWLAIWFLDFTYYNRLLLGAVNALIEIEEASRSNVHITQLILSTKIVASVKKGISRRSNKYWAGEKIGRWVFYSLVFVVLLSGTMVSLYNWRK